MEAEGDADGEVDRGDGRGGEVLRVEDHDVGRVAVRVVHVGHHPALVLGGVVRLRHEHRLLRAAAAEVVDLVRPGDEVVLDDVAGLCRGPSAPNVAQ